MVKEQCLGNERCMVNEQCMASEHCIIWYMNRFSERWLVNSDQVYDHRQHIGRQVVLSSDLFGVQMLTFGGQMLTFGVQMLTLERGGS